jgi:hypothetical protein
MGRYLHADEQDGEGERVMVAGLEMFRGGLEAEIEIWAWSRFTPFPGSLRFPGRLGGKKTPAHF